MVIVVLLVFLIASTHPQRGWDTAKVINNPPPGEIDTRFGNSGVERDAVQAAASMLP